MTKKCKICGKNDAWICGTCATDCKCNMKDKVLKILKEFPEMSYDFYRRKIEAI